METLLRLAFSYETAILWQNGIGVPDESLIKGYLYPTGMRIREDGRLVVNFRTEARFRGCFVPAHSGADIEASVTSPDHRSDKFSLISENLNDKILRKSPSPL